MLTLYHGRTSVCSIKVRLALAEKGVSFDSRLMTLRWGTIPYLPVLVSATLSSFKGRPSSADRHA